MNEEKYVLAVVKRKLIGWLATAKMTGTYASKTECYTDVLMMIADAEAAAILGEDELMEEVEKGGDE